ncbi:hypothetical protein RCH10_004716 [Variovorax sp. GrIS 2.14]|uniref:hypothetical protein n=1 Tax=Variovorax sp. GrIS 2.14 TaxID=3071709 RepID=UPI0038F6A1FC
MLDEGHKRVPALDVIKRLKYRISFERIAVLQPPMKFANPDRDARKFSGELVLNRPGPGRFNAS